ncbi:hypothetical protein Pelo_8586 [Pelomyxa schiedti]|nr:hypothetical protein Pelo_8586 [Pelomyxa schiedti]
MKNTQSDTHTTSHSLGERDRVVWVSRVVWECVVMPHWLNPKQSTTEKHAVDLFAAAEALFPLVALACSKVLREYHQPTYFAVTAAAMANSPSCVAWILSHRHSPTLPDVTITTTTTATTTASASASAYGINAGASRVYKECVAALWGLCRGGHLDSAKSLVERGGWAGLRWPAGEIMEDIRGFLPYYTLLREPCEGGHVETAKWVISTFGIRESWEFLPAMKAALVNGHGDLAQWMAETYQLPEKWKGPHLDPGLGVTCARGKDPMLVKWCLQQFPRDPNLEISRAWVDSYFGIVRTDIPVIRNVEVFKWAITTFVHNKPKQTHMEQACAIGVTELIQWLIEEKHATPKPSLFTTACSLKCDLSLVQWLSTKVSLSSSDLKQALLGSLACNKIAIANWLEDTHHVMNLIKAEHGEETTFLDFIRQIQILTEDTSGVTWFLQHIDISSLKGAVVTLLEGALDICSLSVVLLLFEVLPLPPQIDDELLVRILSFVLCGEFYQVKHFVSLVALPTSVVAKALTSAYVYSSKVVKWIVSQFHLTSQDIKLNNNFLLCRLLLGKKINCCNWLIRTFGITGSDLLPMGAAWCTADLYSQMDLSVWKFIHRTFPTLTGSDIRQYFMRIVVMSPATAAFAMEKYGITLDDINKFQDTEGQRSLSQETRLWVLALNNRQTTPAPSETTTPTSSTSLSS